MHEFQKLEDGAINALAPLVSMGCRTLDAYSGQLDVEEIEEVTLRFPCLYLFASGIEATERNQRVAYEMGLTLIAGDRNLRGAKTAARGDSASPGVYWLLTEARSRLLHIRVVAGWSPLVLVREVPIVYEPKLNICLYQAEYRTKAQS